MANTIIDNVNTLVEKSNTSIKILINNKEYWLMGVDEHHAYLLATNDQEEETFILLTESLLETVVRAAFSQVNLYNLFNPANQQLSQES